MIFVYANTLQAGDSVIPKDEHLVVGVKIILAVTDLHS